MSPHITNSQLLQNRLRFVDSIKKSFCQILTIKPQTSVILGLKLKMFFQSAEDKLTYERARSLPVQYMQQRAPSLDVAFRDPRPSYAPESGKFTVSNEVDIIWVSNRFAILSKTIPPFLR